MQGKDYYAVLQVHREAEIIVIEAAYRRLAREYHPDVSKAPNAHERMVLINEAFETLSDPETRRAYDRGRTGAAATSSAATRTGRASSQPKAERKCEESKVTPPFPPSAADFGIAEDYFDRVVEGARAWKKRSPALPPSITISIRIVTWTAGFSLLGFSDALTAPLNLVPMWLWLGIPVAIESLLAMISAKHDVRLRKEVFDPQYSPNPDGYARYAEEFARYEQELSIVYVARSGYRFHNSRFCGNMMGPSEVKRYVAAAKGYTACSRCGYLLLRPKLLPPPFGTGPEPALEQVPGSADRKRPVKFGQVAKVASAMIPLAIGGAMWVTSNNRQKMLATAPVIHPFSPISEPNVEDFSNLTAEQVENLKAERDFTPEAQTTMDSDASGLGTSADETATRKSSTSAVEPENAFQYLIPTKPSKLNGTSPQPLSTSLDEEVRHSAAQRLVDLGYVGDTRTLSLSEMLNIESRLETAKRLKDIGYEADWKRQSLSEMLNIESRIETASRLKELGYIVDWRKELLNRMLYMEARIETAKRLKDNGVNVDWQKYSLSELIKLKQGRTQSNL